MTNYTNIFEKNYPSLHYHTDENFIKRLNEIQLNFETNAKSVRGKALKMYHTFTFISIFVVIKTTLSYTNFQHSKMQ